MTAKYIVISKKTRSVHNFDNAEGVSVFMWGRHIDKWAVYQLQENLPAEISDIKSILEAREKVQI